MNDQRTVRLVIGVLGLLALTVVVGGIFLVMDDKQMPDALIALGSVSVGAVAGILSRTNSNEPQPVEVVNVPADPIPVEETAPAKRVRKAAKDAGQSVLAVVVVVLVVLIALRVFGAI